MKLIIQTKFRRIFGYFAPNLIYIYIYMPSLEPKTNEKCQTYKPVIAMPRPHEYSR